MIEYVSVQWISREAWEDTAVLDHTRWTMRTKLARDIAHGGYVGDGVPTEKITYHMMRDLESPTPVGPRTAEDAWEIARVELRSPVRKP